METVFFTARINRARRAIAFALALRITPLPETVRSPSTESTLPSARGAVRPRSSSQSSSRSVSFFPAGMASGPSVSDAVSVSS